MRVYISADIEGISGVVNASHTLPTGYDYQRARMLMTNEVNAAIEGALEAGATEVVVNDSHGPMTNILIESLHPKAQLITGRPKTLGMMEGIDESYDAVLLIGYHSRMNTEGVLSHSYNSKVISNININGKDVGEFYINTAVAGFYQAPVVLVSGDDVVAKEVKELNEDIETVIVKTAHSRFSAKCLSPSVVYENIRGGVIKALKRASVAPLTINDDINMVVTFLDSGLAGSVAIMPGTELTKPNQVTYRASTIIEAFRALICMYMIASSI